MTFDAVLAVRSGIVDGSSVRGGGGGDNVMELGAESYLL